MLLLAARHLRTHFEQWTWFLLHDQASAGLEELMLLADRFGVVALECVNKGMASNLQGIEKPVLLAAHTLLGGLL